MTVDVAELRAKIAGWSLGREFRLTCDAQTVYYELLVDGQPTTVPQSMSALFTAHHGPLICAAVNGAEALLQAAEERDALVDAIRDAADDVLGMQELAPATELLGRIGSYAHEQRTRLVNAALRLDVAGVPDDSARTYDRESARVDALVAQRNTALRDLEAVRVGACLGVIPSTFVACGEGGNYCSEACRLRALLKETRNIAEHHIGYGGSANCSRDTLRLAAIAKEGGL